MLIIGLSKLEHLALVRDVRKIEADIQLNSAPIDANDLSLALQKTPVDAIFIRRYQSSDPEKLYPALKNNNRDCVVVELVDSPVRFEVSAGAFGSQGWQIIFDRNSDEFQLALRCVLQHVHLKVDFRRCKSLLYLSETQVSRLVDSSSMAIAYLYQGKILHANIPFLVLFGADSVDEIKRFPLPKLIDPKEHEVFADFLSDVRQSPPLKTQLTLSVKRITGIPFSAKVSLFPAVLGEQFCHQMWVEEYPRASMPEAIPTAKSMNIWDLSDEDNEASRVNPFDQVLKPATEGAQKENRVDVLLEALRHDESVRLRFRYLYVVGQGVVNRTWVKLDVHPDEFKKINDLLVNIPEVSSNSAHLGLFWDRLLFQMLGELLHKNGSDQTYLVSLSASMLSDVGMIMWLCKLLAQLQDKSTQLMLLIDAQMPMQQMLQLQKVIELLRESGCQIALNNFSAGDSSLFLSRRIHPEAVFLDVQWLEMLKKKPDGNVCLSKFVRQIEGCGVSVIIPHMIQKSQNRLFVLSGSSFNLENLSQNCA